MHKQRILGAGIILGTIIVLSLVVAGVLLHRASIQASGAGLLWTDVTALVTYGSAGILVWKQRGPGMIAATIVGGQIGMLVGAVAISNHLIEAFVPARPFILVIIPVLLMFALLGMTGAVAWQRTESLILAVIGGICCAIVATLITLCFAVSFNLLFASRVDWQLREAFAASGMMDRAGFRVKNILEASSEILVRMPVVATCLAFSGAVIQAWMSGESRRELVLGARFVAPILFAAGAAALWHANVIERAARPPFVLSGVLLTGVALCAAYPIWSVFHSTTSNSKRGGNS